MPIRQGPPESGEDKSGLQEIPQQNSEAGKIPTKIGCGPVIRDYLVFMEVGEDKRTPFFMDELSKAQITMINCSLEFPEGYHIEKVVACKTLSDFTGFCEELYALIMSKVGIRVFTFHSRRTLELGMNWALMQIGSQEPVPSTRIYDLVEIITKSVFLTLNERRDFNPFLFHKALFPDFENREDRLAVVADLVQKSLNRI